MTSNPRGKCDSDVRMGELLPAYEALSANID